MPDRPGVCYSAVVLIIGRRLANGNQTSRKGGMLFVRVWVMVSFCFDLNCRVGVTIQQPQQTNAVLYDYLWFVFPQLSVLPPAIAKQSG